MIKILSSLEAWAVFLALVTLEIEPGIDSLSHQLSECYLYTVMAFTTFTETLNTLAMRRQGAVAK